MIETVAGPDVRIKTLAERISVYQTPHRGAVNQAMAPVMNYHVSTRYDEVIADEIENLLDHLMLETGIQNGIPKGRSAHRGGRAVLVQGEAGTGKTFLVNRALALRPEFDGILDNKLGSGALCLDAPGSVSSLSMAAEFLAAMHYPCPAGKLDSPIWLVVRRQLKEREIRLVFIDQMQNAAEGTDPNEAKRVAAALKRLMEDREWPIWIILVGLPKVVGFLLADTSMQLRMSCTYLPKLSYPDDVDSVLGILEKIVQQCPDLSFDQQAPADFAGRLLHAALYRFGIVIEYVQDAIRVCLKAGRTVLDNSDFGDAYASRTGVVDDAQNPFLVTVWKNIDVANAMDRNKAPSPSSLSIDHGQSEVETDPTPTKHKPLKREGDTR